MDLKRLSIEYAFEEVKSGVTMEYVDNFFIKLVSVAEYTIVTLEGIGLDDYHLEHLLWRLFLDSRNYDNLNLKKIYKILNSKERVNAQGYIVEFERPRYLESFYQSGYLYSLDIL